MIVHPVGDTAEIVMQVDHSDVAGDLASLWPGLEPRESVLTAATLHDIGWRSWEACPRLDAETGRPQNFLSVDIGLHLEFYDAGIAEVTARDRYAGMLVGKHLAGIYRQRYGTQAALKLTRAPEAQAMIDEFVGRVEERFLALQRELGVSDEEFWRNYVLLQVFDRLSLWLCKGDPAGTGSMEIVLPDDGISRSRRPPVDARSARIRSTREQVEISVPVRVVPLTGYANEADCAETILAAPVEQRVYTHRAGAQ